MLAKPPVWLDWPPFEAMFFTSSLELFNGLVLEFVKRQSLGGGYLPVGEVSGVGIIRHGEVVIM
jgi:hypothetical protein